MFLQYMTKEEKDFLKVFLAYSAESTSSPSVTISQFREIWCNAHPDQRCTAERNGGRQFRLPRVRNIFCIDPDEFAKIQEQICNDIVAKHA